MNIDDLHIFEDNSVDLIYNCHVLEHFHRRKVVKVLIRLTGMEVNSSFHKQYKCWVDNVLKQGNLSREEIWTTEVAVGSESFVEKIRKNLGFIGKKRISGFKRNEPMAVQEEIAEYGYGQSSNQLEWEIFSDL